MIRNKKSTNKKKFNKLLIIIPLLIIGAIVLLFLIRFNILLNFNIAACASKIDLTQEEIEKFDAISSQYLEYINNKNFANLDKSYSSVAKTLPDVQNQQQIIGILKDNTGDFRDWEYVKRYRNK